eukprot:COSAG02_NODE_1014_length_15195_cov_11.098105_13_plen_287_part_01
MLGLTEDAALSFEQQLAIQSMFDQGDVDSDGQVSQDEFTSMMREAMTKSGEPGCHTLKKHFDDAFNRDGHGYTSQIDIQYVMGRLKEHTNKTFEKHADIAAGMMEVAGASTPDVGITYEQWEKMMVRHDNIEDTNCGRKSCFHIPGAWLYRDAHAFVVSLTSWQWNISSDLPSILLPVPLVLPVTFAPFVLWIWHLAELCSALVSSYPSTHANDVECEFEFFKFNISTIDSAAQNFVSVSSRTLLGLDLSPRPVEFAGLPLTRWLKYLEEEVWNQLTESVLGTTAVL